MHHSPPKQFTPWTLKATLNFKSKNGGMPFDPPSDNNYQQTRAGEHTNHPKQQIIIYQHFLSNWKIIQSQTQQKKTINNSQEPFKFTFFKDANIH